MKKYREFIFESVPVQVNPEINIDQIVYGNPPAEYQRLATREDDPIREWFKKSGDLQRIIDSAPANSSSSTRDELKRLLVIMEEATPEELLFARHIDNVSNLAQAFVDLLQESGHTETMDNFFAIDGQSEGLLILLKDLINRPRPYQLAKAYGLPLYPLMRTDAMTASYPSGHALTGFGMAEYYARKYPDCAAALRGLGERIAKSREITGIHYPSDTRVSREICDILCANGLVVDI